jgi:PHD/YefM family antitoxin component YafN of YafNO toxin-antitoxin module
MFLARFNKERTVDLVESLAAGKPIEPPHPGVWQGHDMIALAAALYAVATRLGPAAYGLSADYFDQLHEEHQEAELDTLARKLRAGFDYFSTLSGQVIDGTFDSEFLGSVTCVVRETDSGITIVPVVGQKSCPEIPIELRTPELERAREAAARELAVLKQLEFETARLMSQLLEQGYSKAEIEQAIQEAGRKGDHA